MTLLEAKVINFKNAIREKKSKHIVTFKYTEYMKVYDNIDNKTLKEKLDHHDLFYMYCEYMRK
jgi:hypothetical protein